MNFNPQVLFLWYLQLCLEISVQIRLETSLEDSTCGKVFLANDQEELGNYTPHP